MTKVQATKVMSIDAQARALHIAEMRKLDPSKDPDAPPLLRFLNQDVSGSGPF